MLNNAKQNKKIGHWEEEDGPGGLITQRLKELTAYVVLDEFWLHFPLALYVMTLKRHTLGWFEVSDTSRHCTHDGSYGRHISYPSPLTAAH